MELAFSGVGALNYRAVDSQGDRVSRIEVHVTSACENQKELALLLRPLYHQGVLYIPSRDALEGVDGTFNLRLALADESTILRALAKRVDPFAHGLTTGGYPGFALLLSELDPRGREFVGELTRSMEGTLPFGIPTGSFGHDRILCQVALEEFLEPTMPAPLTSTQPVTEVADTRVRGTQVAGTKVTRVEAGLDEEPEEATIIVGEDTFTSMAEDEQTAVGRDKEPSYIGEVETDLLANMLDNEEATAVVQGPPAGVHALAPPLPARSIPLSAPVPMPVAAPVSAPTNPLGPMAAPPLATNNPTYDEMPSSILLGPSGGQSSNRPHTITDFISSVSSSNRPLIISTLAAVLLGLGTGYLLWGSNDGERVVTNKPSEDEDQGLSQPSDRERGASTDPTLPSDDSKEAPPVEAPQPLSLPKGTCQVSISTIPEGAALFYQGTILGVTPYLGAIDCQAQGVDIRHSHFQAALAKFEIVDGQGSALVELERPRFWVTVSSVPGKATIKRDGEFLGKTPMSLRLPAYESTSITIARKGFDSQTVALLPTKYKSAVNLRLQRKR